MHLHQLNKKITLESLSGRTFTAMDDFSRVGKSHRVRAAWWSEMVKAPENNWVKKLEPKHLLLELTLLMIGSETTTPPKFGRHGGENGNKAKMSCYCGFLPKTSATARYEFSFATLPLYLIISFVVCQYFLIHIKKLNNEASNLTNH